MDGQPPTHRARHEKNNDSSGLPSHDVIIEKIWKIIKASDVSSITKRIVRERLEKDLQMSLTSHKTFINNQIVEIFHQVISVIAERAKDCFEKVFSSNDVSGIMIEFLDPKSWTHFMEVSELAEHIGKSIGLNKTCLKKEYFLLETLGLDRGSRTRIMDGIKKDTMFFLIIRTGDNDCIHLTSRSLWGMFNAQIDLGIECRLDDLYEILEDKELGDRDTLCCVDCGERAIIFWKDVFFCSSCIRKRPATAWQFLVSGEAGDQELFDCFAAPHIDKKTTFLRDNAFTYGMDEMDRFDADDYEASPMRDTINNIFLEWIQKHGLQRKSESVCDYIPLMSVQWENSHAYKQPAEYYSLFVVEGFEFSAIKN